MAYTRAALPEKMENGEYPAYAWPGGYPIVYMCADGACLCPDCVNANQALVVDKEARDWYVIAYDINYEDGELYCVNCETRIESAYAETDTSQRRFK